MHKVYELSTINAYSSLYNIVLIRTEDTWYAFDDDIMFTASDMQFTLRRRPQEHDTARPPNAGMDDEFRSPLEYGERFCPLRKRTII